MIVLILLAVIGLAVWAYRSYEPLPETIPPAAGEPVPAIDINAPGRTADQLLEWSQPIAADTRIPGQALRAYANAAQVAAEVWPQCHLTWTTLAGVGFVESRHGRLHGDSDIDADGVVRPTILGPALDGTSGFAEVPDSDGGALDADTTYDRAVGPLQFIPQSWEFLGRDGSGDGVADPNNIDDAAVTAAALLCFDSRDLATEKGWTAAINNYNLSGKYLREVRDAAAAYALRKPASLL
ncbi:MAG: hypothetical protein SPI77_04205 [Corynebacterium sp.]|nr:hypothetical protein [Corynebacterium sp.]